MSNPAARRAIEATRYHRRAAGPDVCAGRAAEEMAHAR